MPKVTLGVYGTVGIGFRPLEAGGLSGTCALTAKVTFRLFKLVPLSVLVVWCLSHDWSRLNADVFCLLFVFKGFCICSSCVSQLSV